MLCCFPFSLMQSFSFVQQYIIILLVSFVLLFIFNYGWYILCLPVTTILINLTLKHLYHGRGLSLQFSGRLYHLLVRKRFSFETTVRRIYHSLIQKYWLMSTLNQETFTGTLSLDEMLIEKECNAYMQTIITRYICVWYHPYVSTDQEFTGDLIMIFQIIINRFNDRFKKLKPHDITKHTVHLARDHIEQCLHAYDSYWKKRKMNDKNTSVVDEFSRVKNLHHAIAGDDVHGYLKVIAELILTDTIPESLYIYSSSRAGHEFLTQIMVSCLLLPILNQLSKPRMLYYLIVLLWESEEEREKFKNENISPINHSNEITDTNENDAVSTQQDLTHQSTSTNRQPSIHIERIIYSASIIGYHTAYDPVFGSAYTVYEIQCSTKSPFMPRSTHEYIVPRRFSEFLNLHKRLQQNPTTNRYYEELNDIFRNLPIPLDSMHLDVINRRKLTLQKYIQKLIDNEILNCTHDVLEFFAYNCGSHTPFELSPSRLSILAIDRVTDFFRSISDVGTKLNKLRPTRRETNQLHETFQLNISTTYEENSSIMHQFKHFNTNSSFRCSASSLQLNSMDAKLLKLLLTPPSTSETRRNQIIQSNIPLTDAVLNLIHTCLNFRDTYISNESIHRILRVIFGHFIEELLKHKIDDLCSKESFLKYLIILRTKVLWPTDNLTTLSMGNIRSRARRAILNQVPNWLKMIVGTDNVERLIKNFLQCLHNEKLNQHFICNLFDLFIDEFIPYLMTRDFLTKFIQMRTGHRT